MPSLTGSRVARVASPCRWAAGLHLLWLFLLVAFWPVSSHAQEAECADVRIVIEQKLSLERQAFDAHMVIRNGLEGSALTNVKVELTYLDQNQQPVIATTDPNAVGAVFFQRLDQITGINTLDGSSNLPSQTTADIHWLIIPSQGAGGDTANGRLYYVGAKVTYTLDGQTATVDVTPDYVVVRPQPLLVLDYFLPTDVYADDAFTPQVEPPVPFTLGVRISNVGAGTSMSTTIESAQPRIVDNQQGLLINFEILGGYVGNALMGKSLLLDFGDIPGQQVRVGRWIMQTSLSGQFLDFTASYTHADSLGGAVTSLLQAINTHKLVHDVLIDLPGRDNIPDFLAEAGSGVRVFDSEGGDYDVINATPQASLAGVGGGNQRLSFNPTPGLVWAKVSDPYSGARAITRVVRSDGKILPPQNYWLSKTRNADKVSWSYSIQIFDSNSTGSYTLEFSSGTSTASLSGQAYFDANGNGILDAGEAPESNLTVTLTGIDQQGSNILVTAYTDPAGKFSFGSLAPGRYQLQAGAVNGKVDGAWAAGTAGGTAQPGAITGIMLAAGTVGQGYLIAKTLPTAPSETAPADLSVTLQTSSANLHAGDIATITAKVSNAGEGSAQAVTAQVAIPAGLTLQTSSASGGTYANGVWTLGEMAKGQQATLTLTVKANSASGSQNTSISWPASVSSATPDPRPDNNSALLGLTVLAASTSSVELTQTLPAQPDVLLLVSCPAQPPAEQPDCETSTASQAQSLLASRVHTLKVVTDQTGWRQAARSGAYNLLWLHGGAGKLDAQQLQEVRAAVQRGATLIVDGQTAAEQAGAPATHLLADVLGGQLQLPALGHDQSVHLAGQTDTHASAGPLYQIDTLANDAYVMMQNGTTPVMASHTFGLGQTWLTGFDLLQTLPGSASAFWDPWLNQQIQIVTPAGRANPALAGARLTVQASALNNAAAGSPAQDVTLRMDVPAGATWQDATPTPSSQGQQVQWNLHLAPTETAAGQITLILPQGTASLQLQTALLDANQQPLDSQSLTIQVLDLDTLIPQVQAELAALGSTDPATQTLIEQARGLATQAQTAQTASDWNTALTALANLQATLTQLEPSTLNTLRLDVARWIGLAQSHWQDSAPTAAKVLVYSGSGQSAEVNTAFANPLIAQVLDAQNHPVKDAVVHFTLPATGASAAFAGSPSANATTNAQGLATSPTLTANATAGQYTASARVDGVAETASFTLTNQTAGGGQPTVGPPAYLLLVSGGSQSAQVNTAFGAPIKVQVLDANNQFVSANVTFAFAASGPSAVFPGNQRSATVATDSQGMATSPAFTANGTAGAHQVTVTVAGLTLNVDLTNTGQAPTTTLSLQLVQGGNQSAPIGQAYGQGLKVRVTDSQGQPRAGMTVTFTLPASGPSGSFGQGSLSASAVTGADGTALSPVPVANNVEGDYQAQATTQGAQALSIPMHNLPYAGSGKQFTGTVATGTGTMTATVTGGGATCVFNPQATGLAPADPSLSPGNSFKLPYGLFGFELVGCDPGSIVTISTTWPDLKGVSGYLKHGRPDSNSNAIWYVPGSMTINGNTITYSIQDGGKGDDDLTVNGVIRDPGGPIIGSLSAPAAIPALSTWALALLAAILAAMGVGIRRRA